jgi:dienelactone hydrolase
MVVSMSRWIVAVAILLLGAVEAQGAIVEQEIQYQSDTMLKGYIVYDDRHQGKRPGVLVVHEWWGHNEYARVRARMLAKLGYVALAVDMYGDGRQADHPEDAKQFSSELKRDWSIASARFMAAMSLLNSHPMVDADKTAAIGYCLGGAIVLQMARDGMDLDAVVSFHGSLSTPNPARPGIVKAKIMVAHGRADPFVTDEQVAGFVSEMDQVGADFRVFAYEGAMHSFTNPDADRFGEKFNMPLKYDRLADDASWAAMRSLFDEVFQSEAVLR